MTVNDLGTEHVAVIIALVSALAALASAVASLKGARATERSVLQDIRPQLTDGPERSEPAKVEGAGLIAHRAWDAIGGSVEVPGLGRPFILSSPDVPAIYSVPCRNAGSGTALVQHANLCYGGTNRNPIVEAELIGSLDRYVAPGEMIRLNFIDLANNRRGFSFQGCSVRISYSNVDESEHFQIELKVSRGVSTGHCFVSDVNVRRDEHQTRNLAQRIG